MAKDEQKTAEEVYELNADELAEAMGVNQMRQDIALLRQENEYLREIAGHLLTYQNLLQRSVEALAGEGTVTEDLQFHVKPGGAIETTRRLPDVPGNVAEFMKVLSNRPEGGGFEDGKRRS